MCALLPKSVTTFLSRIVWQKQKYILTGPDYSECSVHAHTLEGMMPHHGQNSTGHSATPGAGEEALAIVRFAPPPTKKIKKRETIIRQRQY